MTLSKEKKNIKHFLKKNNNKNEENIEKEFQEKEIIINYYIGPLCENIFPALKRAKFHEDEKYKDIFCKIFLDLISCMNKIIVYKFFFNEFFYYI